MLSMYVMLCMYATCTYVHMYLFVSDGYVILHMYINIYIYIFIYIYMCTYTHV